MHMSILQPLCVSLVLLAPALVHAATLENPRTGSFYSGIGVISGWKCTASGALTVRFNDGAPLPLAYGNERGDVRDAGACPSTQVGFVSIMNWAELGDGTHTAVAYDNGVEFARSTFTVATTGEPFVTGAAGECRVSDFPAPGETMRFAWNEATQHLELVGDNTERGMGASRSSRGSEGLAALENPRTGSFYSGIGVISGWKCQATGALTVRFNDGAPLPLAYGNERGDVRDAGACPSTQVGFVSIMNWAELGDGTHTAVAYDNGVEFARSTFTVATTGEPFVTGAAGECRVSDFPAPGETMRFAWNEATQHLELVGDRRGGNGDDDEDGGSVSGGGSGDSDEERRGICGRTPTVHYAILQHFPGRNCEDITAEHLATITTLSFYSFSSFRDLKAGDFAGLVNLEDLTLGFARQLSSLPPELFADLANLKTLDLYGFWLPSLLPGLFADLANLERLWLSGSALTALPSGLFADLANLEELAFYRIGLTTLPPGLFHGLTNLETLRLDHNEFTTLPSGLFHGLTNLELLGLHLNALTTLPPDVFAGLAALKTLWLHNNALTTLPPGLFAGLAALETLRLEYNQLTTLPPGVFHGLTNLKCLRLGYNQLTTLSPELFAGLVNLEELRVYGNPGYPFPGVTQIIGDHSSCR